MCHMAPKYKAGGQQMVLYFSHVYKDKPQALYGISA